MPVQVAQPGKTAETFSHFDLAQPDMQLNLTSDPWFLDADKMMPKIVGRDVVGSGTLQPEGGRHPVDYTGSSELSGTWRYVMAEPSGIYGIQVMRIGDIYANGYVGTSQTLKNTTRLMPVTAAYAWPQECLQMYLIKNADERNGPCEVAVINSISTTTVTDDTINFSPPFQNAWAAADKFSIVFAVSGDKRGIVAASNSQVGYAIIEFLIGGVLDKYFTVPTVTTGQWRCAQIASDRLMFVHPYSPTIIIKLKDAVDGTLSISTVGGLLPPGSSAPAGGLIGQQFFRGLAGQFIGFASGFDAGMTSSTSTKILVRAINMETGSESELVQVRNTLYGKYTAPSYNDPTVFQVGFAFNDGSYLAASPTKLTSNILSGLAYKYAAGDQLVITAPSGIAGTYTLSAGPSAHAGTYAAYPYIQYGSTNEVTHNGAFGVADISGIVGYIKTYSDGRARGRLYVYTDNRGLLLPYDPKWTHLEIYRTTSDGGNYYLERVVEIPQELDPKVNYPETFLAGDSTMTRATCEMSDDQLISQISLNSNDLAAGRLPPAGRFIASLGGCTIIGGKAYPNNFLYTENRTYFVAGFDHVTKVMTVSGGYANLFFGYEYQTGDQIVITSPGSHAGTYGITSPGASTLTLTGAGALGSDVVNPNFIGYIKRTVKVPWPYIASDEEIRHSRFDKFAPDSFMAAPVRLSNTGDTMMGLVAVSNYVACIMKSGVHLLRNDGTGIKHDAIAVSAAGTPWEDSIAVFDDMVVWAHPQGVKVMRTFPEPNVNGQRAEITWLDGTNLMRNWFADAFRLGYRIDTGVDTLNQCIRFRRWNPSYGTAGEYATYETLQYSYKNGLWTILEDDSGFRYVRAKNATSAGYTDERLYSVSDLATFREVNYQGTDFPYTGSSVQGTIGSGGFTLHSSPDYITKVGAFSASMIGEVIVFRSSNANVNGQKRIITNADADKVYFEKPAFLTTGDEFLIGAVKFLVRSAPLQFGAIRDNTKTLHDLRIRAILGRRTTGSASAGKKLTVRAYRNLGSSQENSAQDVTIYDDEVDLAYKDEDRVSSLEGQGSLLQIEIEHLETRSDFKLVTAAAVIREESSQISDQSASA